MGAVVLGIDLGTSYTTAAAVIDGRAFYAVDGRGEASIPSAVYFPKQGAPVVGHEAERMRAHDPTGCVVGIKRLLAAEAGSDEARFADATSAFKIQQTNARLAIVVRNQTYDPIEIASMIYRYARERAEVKFGKRINAAVLTVPVRASKRQIDSTLRAAKIAGLEATAVIHEPAAGALALGLHTFSGDRNVMVFDFGGGTFDVTVLRQHRSGFDVLSSGGDNLLGGDNFDDALAQMIFGHIWRTYKVELRDLVARDRILRACEAAKRALSTSNDTRFRVRDLPVEKHGGGELDLVVSRNDVEIRWQELVARSIKESAETLLNASMRPADLERIVMVGGTTFVPLVRRQVAQVFQRPCVQSEDPQLAVATGAALLGARAVQLSSERPIQGD